MTKENQRGTWCDPQLLSPFRLFKQLLGLGSAQQIFLSPFVLKTSLLHCLPIYGALGMGYWHFGFQPPRHRVEFPVSLHDHPWPYNYAKPKLHS